MKWWLGRIRLKIHCFVNLHQPNYHHVPPNATVVQMKCSFCGKIYYKANV